MLHCQIPTQKVLVKTHKLAFQKLKAYPSLNCDTVCCDTVCITKMQHFLHSFTLVIQKTTLKTKLQHNSKWYFFENYDEDVMICVVYKNVCCFWNVLKNSAYISIPSLLHFSCSFCCMYSLVFGYQKYIRFKLSYIYTFPITD